MNNYQLNEVRGFTRNYKAEFKYVWYYEKNDDMYNKTINVKNLIDALSKCEPNKKVFIENIHDGEDPYYRVGHVIPKIVETDANVRIIYEYTTTSKETMKEIANDVSCKKDATFGKYLTSLLANNIVSEGVWCSIDHRDKLFVKLQRTKTSANLLPDFISTSILEYQITNAEIDVDGKLMIYLKSGKD